nr:MAG TPA: hypothetical protein [Inoviridae sp.]
MRCVTSRPRPSPLWPGRAFSFYPAFWPGPGQAGSAGGTGTAADG